MFADFKTNTITIRAEEPVIPIDDCPYLLVLEFEDERITLTPPTPISVETFGPIATALATKYDQAPEQPNWWWSVFAKFVG